MRLLLGFAIASLLGLPAPAELAEVVLSGAATDSRECGPGSLFFAFRGERAHGGDFVRDAFARGAVAAVVEKGGGGAARLVGGLSTPLVIEVPSALAALQKLAGEWRDRMPARVVGVTGSIGKTVARDVIATVLAERFQVVRSERNYNNEIGLPLTLLKLGEEHDYAVLEMGMYALGEIRALCALSRPSLGVVTNVGPTHLGRLGSIEHIAAAKAELLEALPAEGLAVLNSDDERVRAMAERAACPVLSFGLQAGNELRATTVESRGLDGIELEIAYQGARHHLLLPMPGRGSAYAALAGAAVGLACGLSWDEILSGLGKTANCSRLKVCQVGGLRLLDDSYNAAPASVAVALELLREMPARRVAVLGDMLELGSYSETGHREVGRLVPPAADLLVTVGQRARWIAEEARATGMALDAVRVCATSEEAGAVLGELAAGGDTILIKGSRAMQLESLVEALVQRA